MGGKCVETPEDFGSEKGAGKSSNIENAIDYDTSPVQRSPLTPKSNNFALRQSAPWTWGVIYEQVTGVTATGETGAKYMDIKRLLGIRDLMAERDIVEIIVERSTARLDLIANYLYGTPHLWWAVRIANYDAYDTPFSTIPNGSLIKVYKREALFEAIRTITG